MNFHKFAKVSTIDQATVNTKARSRKYHQNEGGYNYKYPTPLEDWDMLRLAKQKCERCLAFDTLNGGCRYYYLPGECEK